MLSSSRILPSISIQHIIVVHTFLHRQIRHLISSWSLGTLFRFSITCLVLRLRWLPIRNTWRLPRYLLLRHWWRSLHQRIGSIVKCQKIIRSSMSCFIGGSRLLQQFLCFIKLIMSEALDRDILFARKRWAAGKDVVQALSVVYRKLQDGQLIRRFI